MQKPDKDPEDQLKKTHQYHRTSALLFNSWKIKGTLKSRDSLL